MPDDLGGTLAASNDGDDPPRWGDGVAQEIVGMENDVAEVWSGPVRNVRHKASSKHDGVCAEHPAVELDGKALLVQPDLTNLRAKFDIGQAAGHPLQVLIEFLPTDPSLRPVDKPVKPLVGAKKRHEGVRTCGIDQRDQVFQVGNLDGRLRKEEAGVPLEVSASIEESRVEARGSQ